MQSSIMIISMRTLYLRMYVIQRSQLYGSPAQRCSFQSVRTQVTRAYAKYMHTTCVNVIILASYQIQPHFTLQSIICLVTPVAPCQIMRNLTIGMLFFRSEEHEAITSSFAKLSVLSNLRGLVASACDCSFVYWVCSASLPKRKEC